jgi:hypothetical protein
MMQGDWFTKGKLEVPDDGLVLQAYQAVVPGFSPKDPASDQGAEILPTLQYWKGTGFPTKGGKNTILGFCQVNVKKKEEVQQAISLFGNCLLGLAMPEAWVNSEGTWPASPAGAEGPWRPGSWGGHCVPVFRYDETGVFVVTWGTPWFLPWEAFFEYCDEAFSVLTEDWLEESGSGYSGLEVSVLLKDLTEL